MSFIQWLGDWLRKVSTSVKSITAGTNSLTYTKHNNDTVTIPLTIESDLYVKKTGDTVTGNINSLYGVNGIETVNQFSGEMAGNDLWAIRTGITGNPDPSGASDSTTIDNGFLEIATADNGTEPIYISQYTGDHMLPDSQGIRFYQQVRRATLLDEHGNTIFPGTVTAASFNGNATSANYATNANYATSAGTASKLGSVDVGSATQPIYLDNGVATACSYQLHKTVPSDAVFTDTVYTHPTYTARTGKPTQDQTPAFGNTVTVSQVESDGTGHVTGMTDRTIAIPATEASSSAAGLMSASDKTKLDGLTNAVTTVSTSGAGNAVTNITANNGQLSVTKGASFFPLSGGALTGTDIFRSKGNSRLFLSGGSAWNTGSRVWIYSKEIGSGITLDAMATDGTVTTLALTPKGDLKWGGSKVLTAPTLESGTLTPTSNIGSNYSDVKKYGNVGIFILSAGTPITFSSWTKYHLFTSSFKPKSYTAGYIHNQNGTQGGAYLEMETDGKIYLHTTGGTMPTNDYWHGSLVFFTD